MFSTSRSCNQFPDLSRSPPYHGRLPAILNLLLSCICLFHEHEHGLRNLGCTSLVARPCDSFILSFTKNCLSTVDPHLICRSNTLSLFPKLSTSPAVGMQSYDDIVIINASVSNYIIERCAVTYILAFVIPVQRLAPLQGSTVFSVRT